MTNPSIETIAEFRSSNSIPVEQATFTRDRMQEILDTYAAARAREALEEAARIAEQWTTPEQRKFGDGGPAAAIRALIPPLPGRAEP